MSNEIIISEDILTEAIQYGIQETQALDIVGSLPQITAERNILSEQYDEVVKMDIEDTKTAKIAKELRGKIRDNRTKGIQVWHQTTKDYFLKGGQFVDAIKRKEIAVNIRMEENLEAIEKHAEIKRNKEEQLLRDNRSKELQQYREFVPMGIDLGKLDDNEYAKVYNGARLQYEFKIEQDRKAEEQRKKLEQERIDREARKQKILPYQKYIDGFADLDFFNMTNMEADALLQQGEENFQKAKQEYEENKKKAEELIKQNERLQKELKDKEAAEKKAQIEKDKAERKLKTASDKVKLIDFASKISLLHSSIPQVSSNEAKEIVNQVDSYFTKLLEYVKKQSENLDK
jgi:hypothetical protein